MSGSTVMQQSKQTNDELRLIARGVGFLALATGVIYLRVAIGELLLAIRANSVDWESVAQFLLLLAASLSLFGSWWREGIGGLVALSSGLGLAAISYATAGAYPLFTALLYGSPFIIAGSLCLACWRRARRGGLANGL